MLFLPQEIRHKMFFGMVIPTKLILKNHYCLTYMQRKLLVTVYGVVYLGTLIDPLLAGMFAISSEVGYEIFCMASLFCT